LTLWFNFLLKDLLTACIMLNISDPRLNLVMLPLLPHYKQCKQTGVVSAR
jgi:hypothetical protein